MSPRTTLWDAINELRAEVSELKREVVKLREKSQPFRCGNPSCYISDPHQHCSNTILIL